MINLPEKAEIAEPHATKYEKTTTRRTQILNRQK